MLKNNIFCSFYDQLIAMLNCINTWLPPLVLRIILAREFGESGFEKLHGTNWFADATFPFPFNLLPPDISWGLATFFEVVGCFAILFGVATRFFSISLIILTIVAISAVHWPEHWNTFADLLKGYRISDPDGDGYGNYKLPLLYIVMFLPLLFGGAGRLSVDYFVKKWLKKS